MTSVRDQWASTGRVGRDLAAVDWSRTPLGDPETWPASLRSAIQILLTSKFAMWMAWGPELTFFCNDSYRRDTLGTKYPWALGRPAPEVWAEVWGDVESRIRRVLETGQSTWDESLLLFLERSGYVEETYHTFSYSPLADDDGEVRGILCVVAEETAQVIATHRLATLSALGDRVTGLPEAEAVQAACDRLAGNPQSLPFTLVYLLDEESGTVRLAGTSGIQRGHPAAPLEIDPADRDATWPAQEALVGRTARVDDLPARWADLPTGAWRVPPRSALVVPILQPAHAEPYGFLVAALNPFRAVDEDYEAFVSLVASQLATILTDARAYELERQRADTLEQIDQAKTSFFTNVSHEFRTPLTLLLGPAEEALADLDAPLPEVQRQRVEVVQRNALRLLRLVNSLLDFSRVEAGTATPHFVPVDLAQYTRELVSMFESAAQRAGLTLSVDCAALPEPVHVDQEHWAKIVLNLVSNAVKFTFEGGIEVTLRAEDGRAVLRVADSGIGVPDDEVGQLFERFHRVRGARGRSHEGSGIGLALVAELVAAHGGTVRADSTLGAGTTITVEVPFGTAHLPPDHHTAAEPLPDAAGQARGFVDEALRWLDDGPQEADEEADKQAGEAEEAAPDAPDEAPRVLIVDDNADMREYLSALLRPAYQVATAVDGIDALAQLEESTPDLILTDVMMPRLNGFDLLQRLRDQPHTMGVPVIMLSARAGEDGVVEGLQAGADDYLVKPFSARELLARVAVNLELDRGRRVRATLERSRALLDQAQRMARVGSWEVDVVAGGLRGSEEFYRILGLTAAELAGPGFEEVLADLVDPADRERIRRRLEGAVPGEIVHAQLGFRTRDGEEKVLEIRSELRLVDGVRVLRGSLQDVTEQRRVEQALAAAAATEEAAAREHAIAEYLQHSLLPERSFDLEQLEVATYYLAGVEGTDVGGDWYDVIELGAGRVALVVGDVMGRGVRAASVMGQMRSAVRTLARLDLSPAEVVHQLDGFVGELDAYQMVTAVYAVFDATDRTLLYANAGHVPPLVQAPGQLATPLAATAPPLGAGPGAGQTGLGSPQNRRVRLAPGSRVVFYTDGLVERRGRTIDDGIGALERLLREREGTPVAELPALLVEALRPEGPDDDVALLVTRVASESFHAAVSTRVDAERPVLADVRRFVGDQLRAWALPEILVRDVTLTADELVSNAVVHGTPPVDLRLVHTGTQVVLEVQDRSARRPRRRLATRQDEHGRGLMVVEALAADWGTRSQSGRKTVWARHPIAPDDAEA